MDYGKSTCLVGWMTLGLIHWSRREFEDVNRCMSKFFGLSGYPNEFEMLLIHYKAETCIKIMRLTLDMLEYATEQ